MDGDASAAQPGTSEAVSKLIPPQAEAWGTGGTANPSGVLGPKARRGGAGSRPRRDATRRATVSSRQCGLPRLECDICGMMRPLLAHVARDRGHLGRAHRLRPEAELPGEPCPGWSSRCSTRSSTLPSTDARARKPRAAQDGAQQRAHGRMRILQQGSRSLHREPDART